MKKILFVASESVPFIKTGGLADVVGALPKSFNKEYYDVRVVMPNYTAIPWKYRQNFEYVHHFYMDMGNMKSHVHVGIMKYVYQGITYYFIDNETYFGGDKPYGDIRYDIEKFTFFSKAALAILPVIDFKPDIIHCHDWQTGLVPVYLRTLYRENGFFWGTKCIMTIHNLKFQGVWDIKTFKYITGLPDYTFSEYDMGYTRGYDKDANMLKGGIVYADYVTTVSDTYAGEIQTAAYGEGLDGLLRYKNHSLCGIVNGIDYDEYNPETDPYVSIHYNADSFEKKIFSKRALQAELGLPIDDRKFMIGIVSRLTDQKGIDLVKWAMEGIVDENVQMVVLGTGDSEYEEFFKHYQWKMGNRVSANIFFSEKMAHRIYAGCDAVLLPSLFEPCGLTQLISLRYGAVPIVRETGGLRDTVEAFNEFEEKGTGFSFYNYNGQELLDTVNYAKRVYFDMKDKWDRMAIRGMQRDFSWNTAAKRYEHLYGIVLGW